MTHLLISREYPPSSYPQGGIGTYVRHITELLTAAGETVHVIAERWAGAPLRKETSADSRMVVHRVPVAWPLRLPDGRSYRDESAALEVMAKSRFPAQAFAWQAARLAEHLVGTEPVDVIEGQDYEAPLYYLLRRRAAGLGPRRQPPCVVHLHTTRELVAVANGWIPLSETDRVMKHFEDDAIARADALLSPSDFLARHMERSYGLVPNSIERIPYPIGRVACVARSAEVWSHGPIVYVGRLERRKGVFEWIEAAVKVASENRAVRFELIGADTPDGHHEPSVRRSLEALIPRALAGAFTFRGALAPAGVLAHLSQARLAVVPSRFENFPNTCLEAMASGLPVLVSPNGGMAEMVEDSKTGWIASSGSADDLAAALTRALATSPEERAAMGHAASKAIGRLCDNRAVVARHLSFRQRLLIENRPPAVVPLGTEGLRVHEGEGAGRIPIPVGLASPPGRERARADSASPGNVVGRARLMLRHPLYAAESIWQRAMRPLPGRIFGRHTE